MRILRQIKAALPSGKLAVVAVLFMALALGAFRFWDWIKYRVGVITVAMAMLSLNEWAVLTGIFCTIGTFFVNWYYEHKKYLRSTTTDINCE